MALERLKYILTLEGRDKAERGMKSFGKTVNRESRGIIGNIRSIGTVFRTIIGVYAVQQVGRLAIGLANLAENTRVTRMSFERLTKGIGQDANDMLRSVKRGLGGAISTMDAMQSSNRAILLGLPATAKQMEELSRVALRLGRAMGRGPKDALDDLVLGFGRQSRLILDNLGLIVQAEAAYNKFAQRLGKTTEALTENERKLAFFTAGMEAARKKAAQLEGVSGGLTEKWARLKAQALDLGSTVGGYLTPAFEGALTAASAYTSFWGNVAKGNIGLPQTLPGFHAAMASRRGAPDVTPKPRGGGAGAYSMKGIGVRNVQPANIRLLERLASQAAPDVTPGVRGGGAGGLIPLAKKAQAEFGKIPLSMESRFDQALSRMDAGFTALGLRGRGLFGGIATARSGLMGLGLKAPSSLAGLTGIVGKMGSIGMAVGGAVTALKSIGSGLRSIFGGGGSVSAIEANPYLGLAADEQAKSTWEKKVEIVRGGLAEYRQKGDYETAKEWEDYLQQLLTQGPEGTAQSGSQAFSTVVTATADQMASVISILNTGRLLDQRRNTLLESLDRRMGNVEWHVAVGTSARLVRFSGAS